MRGWSPDNFWTWHTEQFGTGNYTISCQVRDSNDQSAQTYEAEGKVRDFRLMTIDCPFNDTECINTKGWAYLKDGNFEEALICFNRSVELDPQSTYSWSSRGTALLKLNRTAESYSSFKKSLDISSDNPGAWEGIGWAYQKMGQNEDAFNAFNEGIKKAEAVNDLQTLCNAYRGKFYVLNSSSRLSEARDVEKKINELCGNSR